MSDQVWQWSEEEKVFLGAMNALRTEHERLHISNKPDYCPFCRSYRMECALTEMYSIFAGGEFTEAMSQAKLALRLSVDADENSEEE